MFCAVTALQQYFCNAEPIPWYSFTILFVGYSLQTLPNSACHPELSNGEDIYEIQPLLRLTETHPCGTTVPNFEIMADHSNGDMKHISQPHPPPP